MELVMEARPFGIFAIGAAGLFLMYLFIGYAQIFLLAASLAVCALTIGGFLILPALRMDLPALLNQPEFEAAAIVEGGSETNVMILEGRPLPSSPFPFRATVKVRLKNIPVLLAMVTESPSVLAAYAGSRLGITTLLDPGSTRSMLLYLLAYLSCWVVVLASIWFGERKLLCRLGAVLLPLAPMGGPQLDGRFITSASRGARVGLLGLYDFKCRAHARDNVALILYDSAEPTKGRPSRGFFFHDIQLELSNP